GDGRDHARPDLLGIVLDPAVGGKILRELLLRGGNRGERGIEHDGARRGRALVDGDKMGRHERSPDVRGDHALIPKGMQKGRKLRVASFQWRQVAPAPSFHSLVALAHGPRDEPLDGSPTVLVEDEPELAAPPQYVLRGLRPFVAHHVADLGAGEIGADARPEIIKTGGTVE